MGEALTRSERVSWALQTSIRNFWFIGGITAVTIIMGVRGHIWTLDAVDAWNFCMSWLALWIESIVGIAMFNQTRRDAKVLREVRGMEEKMATVLAHVEALAMHMETLMENKNEMP
jgi:hypothetical protein